MHICLLFTLESWIISILLIFGNVIIILNVPVLEIKMDLNYFDLSYKPRFDLKGIILINHLSLNINLYGTEFMNSLVIVLQLSFLFYSNDSNDLTASVLYCIVFLVVDLLTIVKDDIRLIMSCTMARRGLLRKHLTKWFLTCVQ